MNDMAATAPAADDTIDRRVGHIRIDEKANGAEQPNVAFTLIGLGTTDRDRRALRILDRALPGHPARAELLVVWDELRQRRAAAASGAGTATASDAPH